MIVAVIPARGGSKRIPRKNILPFAGKPMIAHSISAARETGLFDRIIVTTEDDEIAEVAKAWGAEIPFRRPKELADDQSNTDAVLLHALNTLAEQGKPATYVCNIYATAPFIRPSDIRHGFELLKNNNRRYVFALTPFPARIQRALRVIPGGGVEPFFPEWIQSRSQDLEDAYFDAGQFYWGEAEAFRKELPFYATHSEAMFLPRHRVQDIDTLADWAEAEAMYRALEKK
jgi:N-acylneuraminate cytidylyltransferase